MSEHPTVEQLIDINILEHLEFSSEEEQLAFIEEVSEVLFARILERASHILNEIQQKQLINNMDNDADPLQVMGDLEQHIPHFYEMVGQETIEIKSDILALSVAGQAA